MIGILAGGLQGGHELYSQWGRDLENGAGGHRGAQKMNTTTQKTYGIPNWGIKAADDNPQHGEYYTNTAADNNTSSKPICSQYGRTWKPV